MKWGAFTQAYPRFLLRVAERNPATTSPTPSAPIVSACPSGASLSPPTSRPISFLAGPASLIFSSASRPRKSPQSYRMKSNSLHS